MALDGIIIKKSSNMAAKNHPTPVKHVTCHIKSGDYPLLLKLPMVLGIALINRM